MSRGKRHKDVEYVVSSRRGARDESLYFNDFSEASANAIITAASDGNATLDILVHSKAGARHIGGDDGVERYEEDPDASIFERLKIKVNYVGRVP